MIEAILCVRRYARGGEEDAAEVAAASHRILDLLKAYASTLAGLWGVSNDDASDAVQETAFRVLKAPLPLGGRGFESDEHAENWLRLILRRELLRIMESNGRRIDIQPPEPEPEDPIDELYMKGVLERFWRELVPGAAAGLRSDAAERLPGTLELMKELHEGRIAPRDVIEKEMRVIRRAASSENSKRAAAEGRLDKRFERATEVLTAYVESEHSNLDDEARTLVLRYLGALRRKWNRDPRKE